MRQDEAQKFAKLLRKLASALETNPNALDSLLERDHERSITPKKPPFNPFEILREKGELGLKRRIDKMTMSQIKAIIQANRLDSAGLSNKWQDKRRLADLAFERLRNRYVHGDVFSESTTLAPAIDRKKNGSTRNLQFDFETTSDWAQITYGDALRREREPTYDIEIGHTDDIDSKPDMFHVNKRNTKGELTRMTIKGSFSILARRPKIQLANGHDGSSKLTVYDLESGRLIGKGVSDNRNHEVEVVLELEPDNETSNIDNNSKLY